MTQPATGTTFQTGGFGNTDNRFYARGGLAAALIRDNRGQATSIAPYAAGTPPVYNWSPFAADGNLRNDLFATVLVNGVWVTNTSVNQGFWLIGAFDDKGGPERRPNVKHDDAYVLQSIYPFQSDLTAVGMMVQFNGVQVQSPLLRRLRMNLPLADVNGNNLVEQFGGPGYVISRPTTDTETDYQLILIFARLHDGAYIYTAEGYSLVRLDDIGNYKRDKTASDSPTLGFTVLPDPFHVDIDPTNPQSQVLVPCLYSEWIAGSGWTQIGGVPVFLGAAPVAAIATSSTATVQFAVPVGSGGSYTYQLQYQFAPIAGVVQPWVNVTSTPAGTSTITLTSGSIPAGTVRFQVIATGSATTATATSQYSNSIVLTA